MWDAHAAVQDKKIYVSGGGSPIMDAYNYTFVYDINNDQWSQLPPLDHILGIPFIVGGKLSIIGGRLCLHKKGTKYCTNKVSTYDEALQNWTSYYPNLQEVRCRPGVVAYQEYIIVAGGNNLQGVKDDIEVLNWIENSHWRKVLVHLPRPMWGLTPSISNGYLLIVGYYESDGKYCYSSHKIAVNHITGFHQTMASSTPV